MFKKLFKKLLRIVAIILVILAFIYLFAALLAFAGAFSAGVAAGTSWLGFGFLTFTSGWGLLIAAVATYTIAFLADPVAAKKTADKIVSATADLIEKGGQLVSSAGSAVISSLTPWLLAAGAVALWLSTSRRKTNSTVEDSSPSSLRQPQETVNV